MSEPLPAEPCPTVRTVVPATPELLRPAHVSQEQACTALMPWDVLRSVCDIN